MLLLGWHGANNHKINRHRFKKIYIIQDLLLNQKICKMPIANYICWGWMFGFDVSYES